MRHQWMLISSLALVFSGGGILAADSTDAGKCPVSGDPAKTSVSVDYAGGRLYFCCPACIEAFKKDQARFATRANRQVVATGQTEQVGCPISGRTPRPELSLAVDGTTIQFCCSACRAKVAQADAAGRLDLVYGRGFSKTFKMKGK